MMKVAGMKAIHPYTVQSSRLFRPCGTVPLTLSIPRKNHRVIAFKEKAVRSWEISPMKLAENFRITQKTR